MLTVERILVLGHARCGGIRNFLDRGGKPAPTKPTFLEKWISLLEPVHAKLAAQGTSESRELRERLMEHASIAHSIGNLRTFPFVQDAIAEGRLHLHGGYFDIATGQLQILDPGSGSFEKIS